MILNQPDRQPTSLTAYQAMALGPASLVAGFLIFTSSSFAVAQEKGLWDRVADHIVCESHAVMAAGDPERSSMRTVADRHEAASETLAEEVRRRASEGTPILVTRSEEQPALAALLSAPSAQDGVFDATIHILGRSNASVNNALMEEFGSFHLAAAAAHARAYERYGCSDMIGGG